MARNGSGTFVLINNSWYPAVNGVSATPADWNSLINDIASALTGSVAADGQTPLTGNLNGGSYKLTNIGNGTNAQDAVTFSQLTSYSVQVLTHAASAKTTPVDADEIPLADSAASYGLKKLLWSDLKATLNYVSLTGNQTIAGVKTFSSMPVMPTQSMVRVNTTVSTAAGYGTTNTAIPRFTTIVTSQGSDITYADSAANGASFTINTNGVYAISFTDVFSSAGSDLGISLNSTQLTTGIFSISAADRLIGTTTTAASVAGDCSVTVYLAAGSVIRPHTNGAVQQASSAPSFTITRVS